MTIELTCQGCGQTLSVPDEHAGKKARCPQCQQVNQLPSLGAAAPARPSLPSEEVPFNQPADNPFAKNVLPEPKLSPYAAPHAMAGRYQTPHRGGFILTMGIVSLLCNFFLVPGILAWVMGSSDLKQMRAGQMDASGYGTTQAGMYIGIIATCLFLIGIVLYILLFVLAIGLAAAGAA